MVPGGRREVRRSAEGARQASSRGRVVQIPQAKEAALRQV